ncbi:MAG: non-ribosomal peptide synthetase, partial [bacterium]|nr:non-ribosomal peptide synthetase [bacterium]
QLAQSYGENIADIYPLSPMQEGMLFHALYETGSLAYFEQASYRFRGQLDIDGVKHGLNQLIKRHAILRTLFLYEGFERPVQVVLRERDIDFLYKDIESLGNEIEKNRFINRFKQEDRQRSFALSSQPLMRVALFRCGPDEYEFTWSFHHILMDGWCLGIFQVEFFEIYHDHLVNKPHQLPLPTPYRTYIQWLERQDKEASHRYWLHYLAGYDKTSGIPRWKSPAQQQEPVKKEHKAAALETATTDGLHRLAGKNHVTLNTVVQTLWGILLGKYNNRRDVVFGTVVSGRPAEIEGVETMIGLFINTVPVRIRWNPATTYSQLLDQMQQEAIAGENYHYSPLAEIQSLSLLKQQLLDHVFIFENYPMGQYIKDMVSRDKRQTRGTGFHMLNIEVFEQTGYDFSIMVIPGPRLSIRLEYHPGIYDPFWVEKLLVHFRRLLDQVLANEAQTVDRLTLMTIEEKQRILYGFNNRKAGYPLDKTLHRLLEVRAHQVPDRAAVKATVPGKRRSAVLTYRELDRGASLLAGGLREKGAGAGSLVAIKTGRSPAMVIG